MLATVRASFVLFGGVVLGEVGKGGIAVATGFPERKMLKRWGEGFFVGVLDKEDAVFLEESRELIDKQKAGGFESFVVRGSEADDREGLAELG